MKEIPQQVSESVRRKNPHLYPPPLSKGIGTYELAREHHAKRIRQSSKPLLNKLEQEYSLVLFDRYGQFGMMVLPQSIRFKLGNGIWYKPDFVVLGETGIMAFEVKGPFAHRGGFENLKVAAHQYGKRIKWTLVWKEQGQWKEQIVLP